MKDFLKNTVKTTVFNRSYNTNNGCAVAVGGFDGIHLGHRAMLSRLVSEARKRGLFSAVFTFDSDDSPKIGAKSLALQEKKLEIFKSLGIDAVYSVGFSELRNISAEDFAVRLLYGAINSRLIVCGYDFRFGKDRAGDVSLIESMLSQKGVEVITETAVEYLGEPISSTKIRRLISEGRVDEANSLLGRPFSFSGEVVHGRKLGRTLSFPTLNQIYPESLSRLRFGVYAVECVIDGEVYGGVANFGVKPTVGINEPVCETNVFDFSADCYGKIIEIRFIAFIREETRFSSLLELKNQIEKDKEKAKTLLKRSTQL